MLLGQRQGVSWQEQVLQDQGHSTKRCRIPWIVVEYALVAVQRIDRAACTFVQTGLCQVHVQPRLLIFRKLFKQTSSFLYVPGVRVTECQPETRIQVVWTSTKEYAVGAYGIVITFGVSSSLADRLENIIGSRVEIDRFGVGKRTLVVTGPVEDNGFVIQQGEVFRRLGTKGSEDLESFLDISVPGEFDRPLMLGRLRRIRYRFAMNDAGREHNRER